jgi:hypothetical protein
VRRPVHHSLRHLQRPLVVRDDLVDVGHLELFALERLEVCQGTVSPRSASHAPKTTTSYMAEDMTR